MVSPPEGRVIIKMSVRIPDGREGTIHVFPDDEPRELAVKFCKKYGILERAQIVERHIADNMKALMPASAVSPSTSPSRMALRTPPSNISTNVLPEPQDPAPSASMVTEASPLPLRTSLPRAAISIPYAQPGDAADLPPPPRATSIVSDSPSRRTSNGIPCAHPDLVAALPYPPRQTSAVSDGDGWCSTRELRPSGRRESSLPSGVPDSVPEPAPEVMRNPSDASTRRSTRRSDVSSLDPFDTSPLSCRSGRSAVSESSPRSCAGRASGELRRRRHSQEEDECGDLPVGSHAFLRKTALRLREREMERSQLKSVWMALRLHAVISRDTRHAAELIETREREMAELHMANSRIGELAFLAASGDTATAEAQRREVLASLTPNFAARKAQAAATRLEEVCDRLAGALGARTLGARERLLLQGTWRRWAALLPTRNATALLIERRAREEAETALEATKRLLEKKEKECADLVEMCVQSKLANAELYADALQSANELKKVRTVSGQDCITRAQP